MARNWYPFYVGDYQRKTRHLSMLEHGAYRLLLDHYYATGNALPKELKQLYRICGASTPHERKTVASVAMYFFTEIGASLTQERCASEIEKLLNYSETQSAKAKLRHKSGSAEILPARASHNHNHKETPIVPKGTCAGFDEFWAMYPNKVAPLKARKAYDGARKKISHEEIMVGLKSYVKSTIGTERRYISHPATWLNGGRWADDVKQSSSYPPFVPGHG